MQRTIVVGYVIDRSNLFRFEESYGSPAVKYCTASFEAYPMTFVCPESCLCIIDRDGHS